ncbi:hypothetical protein [Agrococcus baldri]|uniref:Uncharacterized protein n=1 Tax=Agrococcus baldri TaxID=153730 RepID=A0AA87RBW5_9MICO|nr:hypothetical protein [Agrococcus baldri]GEK80224.1 hypothetical protein ABA31_15750 [Agrococcus baldri]
MADASGAVASARQGRALEIATWVMIGLNVLALMALAMPGAAAIELQEQLEHQFDEGYVQSNAVTVYAIGLAACTIVGNGLAIWQRRSWGLAWAIAAAAGCWIVFGIVGGGALA